MSSFNKKESTKVSSSVDGYDRVRAEHEANHRNFGYNASSNGSIMQLSRRKQPYYCYGNKVYSNAKEIRVDTSLICPNIAQNDIERCSNRLTRSKLDGKSESSEIDTTQMARNLVCEEQIIAYLKKNYHQFRDNKARYTLGDCERCAEIGQVSRAQLIGKITDLRDFCHLQWKDNQKYIANTDESVFGTIVKTDKCMVNDTANAMLMIPMDIFRGNDQNARSYIIEHPVFQRLTDTLYGSTEVKINMQQFHWAQIASRPRSMFPRRGRNSFENVGGPNDYSRRLPDRVTKEEAATISSSGAVFYRKNLPVPACMTDSSYGTLVTVVCYPDEIHVLFPGGKRELGETPLDTVLREVYEETGVLLTEEFVVSAKSDEFTDGSNDESTDGSMKERNKVNTKIDKNVDELAGMINGLKIATEALEQKEVVSDSVSTATATAASVKSLRWNPVFNFNPRVGTDNYVFLLEKST